MAGTFILVILNLLMRPGKKSKGSLDSTNFQKQNRYKKGKERGLSSSLCFITSIFLVNHHYDLFPFSLNCALKFLFVMSLNLSCHQLTEATVYVLIFCYISFCSQFPVPKSANLKKSQGRCYLVTCSPYDFIGSREGNGDAGCRRNDPTIKSLSFPKHLGLLLTQVRTPYPTTKIFSTISSSFLPK